MTVFLGIDYGAKRIGLAVGDTEMRIAAPLKTIDAASKIADQVRAVLTAAADYEVDALVVGLPLNMDGTEGDQAKLTRQFGSALAQATTKSVCYSDERLSSVTARELLQPAELSRKGESRAENAVAAQVMLQAYLDNLSSEADT